MFPSFRFIIKINLYFYYIYIYIYIYINIYVERERQRERDRETEGALALLRVIWVVLSFSQFSFSAFFFGTCSNSRGNESKEAVILK